MSSSYSSSEVLRRLARAGFTVISQRGSHVKLRARNDHGVRTVIVKHPARDIPVGTLISILHQAGLTRQEFEGL